MFVVVDASVWVARLVPQDEFHLLVKNWMVDQREDGVQFVSPALLLAEVAGAISRRTRPDLAQRALHELDALPRLRIVEMSNSLLMAAARLAADLGLRGADSVYVATAVQLSVPLLTLDIDQKARAGAVAKILDL